MRQKIITSQLNQFHYKWINITCSIYKQKFWNHQKGRSNKSNKKKVGIKAVHLPVSRKGALTAKHQTPNIYYIKTIDPTRPKPNIDEEERTEKKLRVYTIYIGIFSFFIALCVECFLFFVRTHIYSMLKIHVVLCTTNSIYFQYAMRLCSNG